ncbi:MAG: hypothetical protein ACJAQ4_000334 [Cryomorphaceae bacterium]|jgi:hypothetical protein
MSENLKTGLLVFIAALLVVNTVILVTDDGPSYADPSADRASFERTAAVSANKGKENKAVLDKARAADPLKTLASKTAPAGPVTTMEFAAVDHDFGAIAQDTENTKVFSFTNTGAEPLIIANAKGSCGCTVPEYPKEPIPPGESGEIKVVYKPGKKKNAQSQNVTITANTLPEKSVLTISANVMEAGAGI